MIGFIFVMVIILAIVVCGLILANRALSSAVKDFGEKTLDNTRMYNTLSRNIDTRLSDHRNYIRLEFQCQIDTLRKEVGLSSLSTVDSVRFKKGDFIRIKKDGAYTYWKCHVSDKDLAVFGRITHYRVCPHVLIVSYSDMMVVSNRVQDDCPDDYHRVDSLPDIG